MDHTRLWLRPLSKRNSRRLVKEILQKVEEVPPDLRDLIVRGAEGNPFYVEELIKMLIEDGIIVKGVGRWRIEMEQLPKVRVPPTLTGVLQARLDRLPSVERETLQRASVVGRIFWDSAVERIGESASQQIGRSANERVDESQTSAALRTARGRELVFERATSVFAGTHEYVFKHAILRDVTYEGVLKRLRRIYHAQVAAWLIEHSGERVGEYAGLIGEHYERAGDMAQAAEWYGRAARQAQETYALETALGYYQRALALEECWEWLKGQVEVLHILGRRNEEQVGLQALDGVSKAPTSTVAYLWGQYYEAIGDFPQAQVAIERALMACRDEDDIVGQARCLAQLGSVARRPGDYEDAKDWYNQSLALFQEQETYSDEETQALAQALEGLGTVCRQQGDFDQAKDYYERALVLNRAGGNRKGEAEVLSDLGVIAYYQRHFADALPYHRQALKIRRAIGDRAGEGLSLYNLALASQETGDYGQAQEYFSAALSIQRAIGNRWEEGNILNALGFLYHYLGDLSKARRCLEQGLQLSQEIGDKSGQAYILANLGLVVCDGGDAEAAEQLLADGLALAQAQDDRRLVSYFLSYLGTTSLRAGKLEQAMERATQSLTLRQELGMRLSTTDDLATLAATCLAAGDIDQSLAYTGQALTILEECGGEGPEFPQRDYFICYQVLATAGRTERAETILQSAYDLVMARADKIAAPDLRYSFLERVQVNHEIVQEYESVICDT